jgi:hypothetical protein
MVHFSKDVQSAGKHVLGTFAAAASTIAGATYGVASLMIQYL